MTDHRPAYRWVSQGFRFAAPFLHLVLAEIGGAGADRLSHPFGVDGFRDKDKTDDASGPAGKLRRLGNA